MNRTSDTPSAVSVNALVFSGGEVWGEDEPDAQANAILQTLAESVPGPSNPQTADNTARSVKGHNVSTYVRVFEGAPYSQLAILCIGLISAQT